MDLTTPKLTRRSAIGLGLGALGGLLGITPERGASH